MAIFPGDRVRCAWGPLSGWQQQWNPCSLGSGLKANDGHHFSLLFPQTIFLHSFEYLGLKACHLYWTKKMYIRGSLPQECVLETSMCIVIPHIFLFVTEKWSFILVQKSDFLYGTEKWFFFVVQKRIFLFVTEKWCFFLVQKREGQLDQFHKKMIVPRSSLCLWSGQQTAVWHCDWGEMSRARTKHCNNSRR